MALLDVVVVLLHDGVPVNGANNSGAAAILGKGVLGKMKLGTG